MTLGEYLKLRRIPVRTLAEEVGLNRAYCYQILSGEKRAGDDLAKRIEKWTNSWVTAAELQEGLICEHCGSTTYGLRHSDSG